MFTAFGDVQVVKQSINLFWVEFEGYSNTDHEKNGIDCIRKTVQKAYLNAKLRSWDEAIRFKN